LPINTRLDVAIACQSLSAKGEAKASMRLQITTPERFEHRHSDKLCNKQVTGSACSLRITRRYHLDIEQDLQKENARDISISKVKEQKTISEENSLRVP
jgi:hypothetical protein